MTAIQTSLFPLPQKDPLFPLLKWAGGKRDLAPRLAEIYAPYRKTHIWVEPFCGGLGSALGVMPEKAVLSDVNIWLINLYSEIQSGLNNEASQWETSKAFYYETRKSFNSCLSSTNFKALAFYYLNRICYRGLCRFSKKTGFNVPWGKYKEPILNHNFSLYQKAFEGWEFLSVPYNETLNNLIFFGDKHFIYADPPYDDGFVNYSGDFTWDDQVNLAAQLSELNCPVVASNKATERIIDLYKSLGFEVEIISMARRISCDGNRDRVDEILAVKNV